LLAVLPKGAAEKMFYEIGPKYKSRTGGYLRITKNAAQRMRDGANMATIEFV
jgi:ribosomal protein L17